MNQDQLNVKLRAVVLELHRHLRTAEVLGSAMGVCRLESGRFFGLRTDDRVPRALEIESAGWPDDD